MSRQITSLDRIHIESPCEADWDAMKGNEQVRFCEHCRRSVHNLSEMTRQEALRLVRNSRGRLCVRYVRRPEEADKSSALPVELYRLTRRASHLAAGAFTAVLSLAATAAAQSPSASGDSEVASVEATRPATPENQVNPKAGQSASLVGKVTDPGGAVVPDATITLVNRVTQLELAAFSDEEGNYSFPTLPGGIYMIRVDATGFEQPFEQLIFFIPQGEERRFNVTMGARTEMSSTGGSVAIVSPSSPLVNAAYENNLDGVKELLFKGADVNEVDKDVDATALDEAVANGNLEMVLMLIDARAEVNLRNKQGRTALMFLAEESTPEVVRALIEAGAKVNLKDDDGETALMKSAALEDGAILQLLLEEKAKVNASNKFGETALMKAAEEGIAANVRALIMAGAEVDARDQEGESALDRALSGGLQEIVQMLKSFGATESLKSADASAKR